ncbi:MAG: leishmanolysin-related zinc metalloendopeptidase [Myxococcota bacterium]
MSRTTQTRVTLVLGIFVAGCDASTIDVGGLVQTSPDPAAIEFVETALFSAPVGSTISPTVRVTDGAGLPLQGVEIAFSVVAGGGSVSFDAGFSDAAGELSSAWTLGEIAGTNTLRAEVVDSVLNSTLNVNGEPGTVAGLRLIEGGGQAGGVGVDLPAAPVVVVEDDLGNPVAGVQVTFAVTAGGGTLEMNSDISDGDGRASPGVWTLGPALGPNTVLASSAGLPDLMISAQAVEPELARLSGDLQRASPGTSLPEPIVVEVNAAGVPVAGVTVVFAISFGDGSLSTSEVMTGADGRASVRWTLGPTPGLTTVEATVNGLPPVLFRAAGTDFDIELVYETPLTDTDRDAFENAEFVWEATITNDLRDVVGVQDDSGPPCVGTAPVNIDDLRIAVRIEPDDGPFGTLGIAGPCLLRGDDNSPFAGTMRFDSADTARLAMGGRLVATILHEMGHVIGIGTLWDFEGLIANASVDSLNPCRVTSRDTRFLGLETRDEFAALGGSGNPPLENDTTSYTCGSLDGHFRESVFGSELMTPELTGGGIFSRLTIATLVDLNYYDVSFATADPSYALPTGSGGLVEGPPVPREWCGTQALDVIEVRDDVVVVAPR